MATNPVNLVDAVNTVVTRQTRNRTGILRIGVVVSVAGEWCAVRVSAPVTADPSIVVNAAYHVGARPQPGDVVSLLNDGDRWLALGTQASAANTGMPVVQVLNGTVQSLTNGGYTPVIFDIDDIDTHDMHDLTANKTRLVCKVPGLYQLAGATMFAQNATGGRGAAWYRNGTDRLAVATLLPATANDQTYVPAPTIYARLALNDYIELNAYQGSGASLNSYFSSASRPYASLRMVAP